MLDENPKSPTEQLDDLLRRIGLTLSNDAATIEPVNALVQEADDAIPALRRVAEQLRKKVLDPATSRADISAARSLAENADLDEQRLAGALEQLNEKLAVLQDDEEIEECLRQYQDAEKVRNETASRILDKYLRIQADFLELAEEVMTVNEMIDRVNENLPDGAEPLHRPEGFARGFHDYGSYGLPVSHDNFRLTQSLLPDIAQGFGASWPPIPHPHFGMNHRQQVLQQSVVRRNWKAKEKSS